MSEAAAPRAALPPPQDLDAEESVLGAMLLSPAAIDAVVEEMGVADFYRESHARIYSAIVELHSNGEPADQTLVTAELERRGTLKEAGGREHVHELAAAAVSSGNAAHYARRVHEQAVRRRLLQGMGKVAQRIRAGEGTLNELLDDAELAVFDVAQQRQRGELIELGDTLAETFRRLEELANSGATVVGVPTGFRPLDDLTAGLQPGNLVIMAGRPSMGKSALALSVAGNVAIDQGRPVVLFTLEMSRWEIAHRYLSAKAFVDSTKLRVPARLDTDAWSRLMNTHAELRSAPLLLSDSRTVTPLEVRSLARRAKMRHPDLALVVVDYLQLLSGSETARVDNRVQLIGEFTRALKVLAGDLDVPIVAVSQLSRAPEGRHDKRPLLSDLRESGNIEQDADVVMLLYRDEYYNPEDAIEDGTEGICEVHLAKHRNGPTGLVNLAFVKKYAMFSDLQPGT